MKYLLRDIVEMFLSFTAFRHSVSNDRISTANLTHQIENVLIELIKNLFFYCSFKHFANEIEDGDKSVL